MFCGLVRIAKPYKLTIKDLNRFIKKFDHLRLANMHYVREEFDYKSKEYINESFFITNNDIKGLIKEDIL